MPSADNVTDPDDVPHAQLARLVAPSGVFSHDKHLRQPGYAPTDRATYDSRVAHIYAVARFRETQTQVAVGINAAGVTVSAVVRGSARRLGISTTWAGLALAIVVVAVAATLLRPPERRHKAGVLLDRMGDSLASAVERSTTAQAALAATPLVPAEPAGRLEQHAAVFFACHPDSTITDLRRTLSAGAPAHSVIRAVLSGHPSFTMTGPRRWALGSVRSALGDN
jgi:hypothetical protein